MSTALCPLAAYMQPPTVADDTRQCVVCNQPAEHKCAMCREFLCADHARFCEFCRVSELAPVSMPALRYCNSHVQEIEVNLCICEGHWPDYRAEMKKVEADEMAYEEVMA